jgi:hypothetical protein
MSKTARNPSFYVKVASLGKDKIEELMKAKVVRKVVSQEVPQASYIPNFQSIIRNGQT